MPSRERRDAAKILSVIISEIEDIADSFQEIFKERYVTEGKRERERDKIPAP